MRRGVTGVEFLKLSVIKELWAIVVLVTICQLLKSIHLSQNSYFGGWCNCGNYILWYYFNVPCMIAKLKDYTV